MSFLGGVLRGLVITIAFLAGLSLIWPVDGEGLRPAGTGGDQVAASGAGEGAGQGAGERTEGQFIRAPQSDIPAPDELPDPQPVPEIAPQGEPEIAVIDPAPGSGAEAADGGQAPLPQIALTGPALTVNAMNFDASEDEPLMAIILRHGEPGGVKPETLLALTWPLTISVPPGLADAGDVATMAELAGYEVLAELPVGPEGSGALLTPDLSDQAMAVATAQTMSSFAMAVGATSALVPGAVLDERILRGLMSVLSEHGFGMIGKEGGADVVAAAVAGAMSVPYANRDLTVAAGATPDAVYAALERAAARATDAGSAIVSLPGTLEALQGLQRWGLERSGRSARLAPISAVLRRVSGT